MLSRLFCHTVGFAPAVTEKTAASPSEAINTVTVHEGASPAGPGPSLASDSPQPETPTAQVKNKIWSEITGVPLPDAARKFTADSIEKVERSNRHLTTVTLLHTVDIRTFVLSQRFKDMTILVIRNLGDPKLSELIKQLTAHPPKALTLHLHLASALRADVATRISALPLKALHLNYETHIVDTQVLKALSKSSFPIALSGDFTRNNFLAASRMPTLTTLHMTGRGLDDQAARLFASHPALETVCLGINWNLSSEGVGIIAALPTLRELSIDDWSPRWASAAVARTLAANRRFESLDIRSRGPAVPNANFSMLCESKTLTSLRMPSTTSMPYLANFRTLEHLELHSDAFRGIVCLDPTSARILTSLPKLQSLRLSSMYFKGDALATILRYCRAPTLAFQGYHWFHDGDILALTSNKTVRELIIEDGYLPAADIVTLLSHRSLDRLCINKLEFARPAGHAKLILCEDDATDVFNNARDIRSRL